MVSTKHRYLPAFVWIGSLIVARGVMQVMGSAEAIAQWMPFACPLRVLTGLTCPTCGLGRSLIEAWSGNWSSSLCYHPLGLALLLATGAAAFLHALRPGGSHKLFARIGGAVAARPRLMTAAIAAYVLWGCARQLAG